MLAKLPVTPHAYRKAQAFSKKCQREYEIERHMYLATASVLGGSRYAIDKVIVARQERDQARAVVAQYEQCGVQVGAAWSPRGLSNVRESNSRRRR